MIERRGLEKERFLDFYFILVSKSVSGVSYYLCYRDLDGTTLSFIYDLQHHSKHKALPICLVSSSLNMSFLLRDCLAFTKFMLAYPQIQLFNRHGHVEISS